MLSADRPLSAELAMLRDTVREQRARIEALEQEIKEIEAKKKKIEAQKDELLEHYMFHERRYQK